MRRHSSPDLPSRRCGVATVGAAGLLSMVASAIAQIPLEDTGQAGQLVGMSRDGLTLAYELNHRGYRWTSTGGLVVIDPPQGAVGADARGISGDGDTIVGALWHDPFDPEWTAFRWTTSAGMQDIGVPAGYALAEATATNGDGSIVVGWSEDGVSGERRAFRWVTHSGFTILPTPASSISEQPLTISNDGTVIAGWAMVPGSLRAAYWRNGAPVLLPLLPGHAASVAYGVSDDGSVLVGLSLAPSGRSHTFRYTPSSGMQDLGYLGGIYPPAISGNGTIVGNDAYVWTAANGVAELDTYLSSHGATTTGWTGLVVRALSYDGSILAGFATQRSQGATWYAQKDSDLDGLADDWERNGIPYALIDSTAGRYVLPNANPLRKDIYVEVDCTFDRRPMFISDPALSAVLTNANVTPSGTILDRVAKTFLDAPVDPPLGIPGGIPHVALHVIVDETIGSAQPRDYPNDFADFQRDKSGDPSIPGDVGHFGTPLERADSANWTAKRAAKAKAYRYCIFANTREGGLTGGAAEAPGVCNDFMITLGAYDPITGLPVWGVPGGTEHAQAGVFMHELGHTLGLRHGGADTVNYKPNYYSVMNGWWTVPHAEFNPATSWDNPGPGWRLRFSGSSDYVGSGFMILDEGQLDENVGVGLQFPGKVVPFSVPVGTGQCISSPATSCNVPEPCLRLARMGPGEIVNWDDFGTHPSSNTTANINAFPYDCGTLSGMASHQALVGHDDWANLQYNFRNSPSYSDSTPAAPPRGEPDDVMMRAMSRICRFAGDVDGDMDVDNTDVNTLLHNLGSVGVGIGAYGDVNEDGVIDMRDVAIVQVDFGSECQ